MSGPHITWNDTICIMVLYLLENFALHFESTRKDARIFKIISSIDFNCVLEWAKKFFLEKREFRAKN